LIGSTLSHFKITAKLGEGGMGEVYRAEDTKLGREVAIKVLPEAVSQDPERLARFEREAKVLAALNHTNIAAIYSLESSVIQLPATGPQLPAETEDAGSRQPVADSREVGGARPQDPKTSRPLHFLVMELAEGLNLRDRLDRGPIPLDEALSIALQIAHALEAAHGQGIIHRDLKPANVMVDEEDNVKVLDFGLAKALDPTLGDSATGAELSPSQSPLSLSPTLTAQMTGAGVLLGTAAYMSPEQARGKKADKRADIWAFGVVLWEMLTGKRLFEGETVSDTLAAVLRADPDWEALGPEAPRPLHRLLRRCLERNPKERLHDIADARLEIEEAIDPAPAMALLEAEQHEAGLKGGKNLWAGATAGLVLGAILAGLGSMWFGGRTSETPSRTVRVASALPDEVVVRATEYPVLSISPDGQRLVIAGQQGEAIQLYQRLLSQFEWQAIAGTEGAYDPFFSPNGEWIAFFADGKLKKVSLAGGAPQVLSDAPNPWGGTWGPDGKIVFFPSSPGEGLMRVSELGGAPELLTQVDTETSEVEHNWPHFLPGGKALIFTIWKGSVERSQIALLDLETGERRVLIDGSYGRVVPTGHLLYALADSVYVVPFDLDERQITGPPVPIPEPIYRFSDYWLPYLAVATDGTMVYLPGRSEIRRQLVTVGLDGTEEPVMDKTGAYMYPRVSPDGSKLAVNLMEADGASIWIIDLETGLQSRLSREGNNLYPLWTPDGERIIFVSDRSGRDVIYWRPADSSGPAEELVVESPPVTVGFPTDVSSDGKFLTFLRSEVHEDGSYKSGGIYVLSLEEPREQRPFLISESETEGIYSPTFSPDSRWIAYVLMETMQTSQVFVRSFPEAGASYQISSDNGRKVQWAPNGQDIYFRASDDRFMAVSVTTEPAFKAGIPRLLFEDKYSSGTYIPMPNYSISPDGSRIIMVKPDEELGKASEIRIVFNWLDELEKLVPGGAR